ncbi:MAG: DUF4493 domain-containing protein [Mucinivorans sp.]
MQKRLQILMICMLTLLMSCHKGLDNNNTAKPDQGTLQIGLAIPQPKNEAGHSRAQVNLEAPDVNIFSVSLYRLDPLNTTEPRKWVFTKPYGELREAINLTEGQYEIIAEYGNDKVFNTDKPYYIANQDFTINRGYVTTIDLTASIKPFVVDVTYSADFDKNFTDYYVEAEIDNVTNDYIFARKGTPPTRAYIAPSNTRLLLRGTLKDGNKPYSSIIREINSPGKELYTFKLNVLPKGHTIDIGIDVTVTTITSEGKIPGELLPDQPAVPAAQMKYYETVTTPVAPTSSEVELKSVISFKKIAFTFAGDAFKAAGLNAVTYSTDKTNELAAMKAAGIAFIDADITKINTMDPTADPANIVAMTKVNFAGLAQKMLTAGGVETAHTFTCTTTDITGKTNTNTITISVLPPVFTMPAPSPGNIWSKTVDFEVLTAANVTHGDFAKMSTTDGGFKYQSSTDGTTWTNVASGSSCSNLVSGRQCYLRAVYRGNIFSTPAAFTTEATAQVPNGNMEDWQKEIFRGKMARYYPWSSGGSQWWDTNNTRTCSYDATAFTNAYNSFPATSYIYGGRSGKAAELRTISASGSGLNSATNEVDAHRTPGRLFVGSYKYDGSNAETITRGRGFNSRPTAMTFYYQYEPWGGNAAQGGDDEFRGYIELFSGGVSIGKGEFTHRTSNRACTTDWTQARATINYTDPTKKADQIVIDFVSTTAASPIVSDDWRRRGSEYVSGKRNNNFANGCPTLADFDGGKMWQYYGSVLKLDDIELVYDK